MCHAASAGDLVRAWGTGMKKGRNAWQHDATQRSFRRYWRSARVWFGCGMLGTLGCPWIGITADEAGVK